jgi:hypothetical protein
MYRLLPLFLIACAPPAEDKKPDDGPAEEARPVLEPPPAGEGFQIAISGTAEAYSEAWICEISQIPIEEMTAIQWVEFNQNAGTHHTTLSALGLNGESDIEYGRYDCNDLYGDESLMSDQIMFFGTQGDATGTMSLPEGTVANLPPNIDILQEIHYVNPTEETVEIYSEVNAWSIPQSDVEEMIWGGNVRDENIEIPANSSHSEWSRCVFNEDVEVLFLASHQHGMGTRFTIAPFDGETTGDILFDNPDWENPMITQYETPIAVPAGQGFEWTCHWDNPTDKTVTYGATSEDEMCNMSVVFTPFSMSAECTVVETSDGVLWESN